MIYRRPATAFVLEFVGLSSRLAGTVVGTPGDGMVAVDTSLGRSRGAAAASSPAATCCVAVRPERITGRPRPATIAVRAALRDAVFQGSKVQLHFEAPRATS